MEGTLLVALMAVVVGLVGAYVGYKAVTAVFGFWEGLGMSHEIPAEKHSMAPWIGAIVGAVLAVLLGYLLVLSGMAT